VPRQLLFPARGARGKRGALLSLGEGGGREVFPACLPKKSPNGGLPGWFWSLQEGGLVLIIDAKKIRPRKGKASFALPGFLIRRMETGEYSQRINTWEKGPKREGESSHPVLANIERESFGPAAVQIDRGEPGRRSVDPVNKLTDPEEEDFPG